jgi:hypothetical protein
MLRFSLRENPEIFHTDLEPYYSKADERERHNKFHPRREVGEPCCALASVYSEDGDIEPVQEYSGNNQYVDQKDAPDVFPYASLQTE